MSLLLLLLVVKPNQFKHLKCRRSARHISISHYLRLKWPQCKSKIKTETLKLFINLTPDSFFSPDRISLSTDYSHIFRGTATTTTDEINEWNRVNGGGGGRWQIKRVYSHQSTVRRRGLLITSYFYILRHWIGHYSSLKKRIYTFLWPRILLGQMVRTQMTK